MKAFYHISWANLQHFSRLSIGKEGISCKVLIQHIYNSVELEKFELSRLGHDFFLLNAPKVDNFRVLLVSNA